MHKNQIRVFQIEFSSRSEKLAVETLMEEIKPVNRMNYEFEFRKMAVLLEPFRLPHISIFR